jgi:uncharacterized membrane protein YfcA
MTGLGVFIDLDLSSALQVIALGFIGGVLSGFIGSGGAFFMTPGMMNLGVPGAIAVASNITHKFGKALMGSRIHGEMGHVDKKLGLFMLITAAIGIIVAARINEALFHLAKDSHGEASGSAAGDLYISGIFVFVLSIVSISILRDAIRTGVKGEGPSTKLAEFFSKVKIPPIITFKTAEVRLSFWTIAVVGLFTGYLAGTIGVGGFIGVPAMIYVFGVPTAVAAGTELFLATFMGGWGAMWYAIAGLVDLRLVLLMYLGSLTGIYIGAYGTKVVKEKIIRLVTGIIILLCVFSRAINVPVYLHKLDFITLTESTDVLLNSLSKILLFASGICGVIVILVAVFRAYARRRKVQELLAKIST